MHPIRLQAWIALGLMAASVACSSLRVPASPPGFRPGEFVGARKGNIVLEVRPIVDLEEYWELFEEDLPKAGILAVWVRMRNEGEARIRLDRTTWSLRFGGNRYSQLDAPGVLSQYYKGTRTRMYGLAAHQRARIRLESLMFGAAALDPGQSAEGFVFLKVKAGPTPVPWSTGTFSARGIRLAGGDKLDLEVPLNHGHS